MGGSKALWLGSAWLLLASLPGYSYTYDGPPLPLGWYPIHETELTELETILDRQAETLDRQETTLMQQSTTIERLRTTIDGLGRSYAESVIALQAETRRLRREVWIWRGTTAAALAILVYSAVR